MELNEALDIVTGLAVDNMVDAIDHPEEAERQAEALDVPHFARPHMSNALRTGKLLGVLRPFADAGLVMNSSGLLDGDPMAVCYSAQGDTLTIDAGDFRRARKEHYAQSAKPKPVRHRPRALELGGG